VLSECSGDWTVVKAPKEMNLAEVLNLGLRQCSADFVARLDADDVSNPERFALQLAQFRQDTSVAVVGGTAELIDEAGTYLGLRGQGLDSEHMCKAMRWKNSLVHSSVMFRRDVIERVGGYNANASGFEDYEMWLRVLQESRILSLDVALIQYRIHEGQVSRGRAVRSVAWSAVGEARTTLAITHGESRIAARVRQAAWVTRQNLRLPSSGRSGVIPCESRATQDLPRNQDDQMPS
jgi:glycosyltransferase involved in cell wall biosynthesis